jgi:hypothetical protein
MVIMVMIHHHHLYHLHRPPSLYILFLMCAYLSCVFLHSHPSPLSSPLNIIFHSLSIAHYGRSSIEEHGDVVGIFFSGYKN